MSKSFYIESSDLSDLQREIMQFITIWVHEEKTVVPYKAIIERMRSEKVQDFTTANALNSLLKKGYIRRATVTSNKTFYVLLRTI